MSDKCDGCGTLDDRVHPWWCKNRRGDMTDHQRAKHADFVACLEEYEKMRCDSLLMRVREAALDFALSFKP